MHGAERVVDVGAGRRNRASRARPAGRRRRPRSPASLLVSPASKRRFSSSDHVAVGEPGDELRRRPARRPRRRDRSRPAAPASRAASSSARPREPASTSPRRRLWDGRDGCTPRRARRRRRAPGSSAGWRGCDRRRLTRAPSSGTFRSERTMTTLPRTPAASRSASATCTLRLLSRYSREPTRPTRSTRRLE